MKIAILYSGGLDSRIMLQYARCHYPKSEVKCLWYAIGQDYEAKERAALPDFVEQRTLTWLDESHRPVGKPDSPSGNIFIPGRNLALICAAACSELPDQVWLGALKGETTEQSTDKNYQFLEKINPVLSYVLGPFKKKVIARFPLADEGMSKLDAVKWALKSGLSKEELLATSSCLSGEPGNCGHCVVCLRRWGIFTQLGIREEYNRDPLSCEENRAIIDEMLYGNHYAESRKEEILPALRLIGYR